MCRPPLHSFIYMNHLTIEPLHSSFAKMRLFRPSITTLLFLESVVDASAINRLQLRDSKPPPTQQVFDGESVMFRQQGLCRLYDTNMEKRKSSMSLCDNVCGGDLFSRDAKVQGTVSVTCINLGGLPRDNALHPDPDGHEYRMGYCKCSFPVLEYAVEEFVNVVLPAIAAAACAVMYGAFKTIFETVLEVGLMFVPVIGPEASMALRVAVQAAKTLAENGGTALNFLQYYQNPCGPQGEEAMNIINTAFNPLSLATDAAGLAPPIPCPGGKICGKKSGGKSGDKPEAPNPPPNPPPKTPPSVPEPRPGTEPAPAPAPAPNPAPIQGSGARPNPGDAAGLELVPPIVSPPPSIPSQSPPSQPSASVTSTSSAEAPSKVDLSTSTDSIASITQAYNTGTSSVASKETVKSEAHGIWAQILAQINNKDDPSSQTAPTAIEDVEVTSTPSTTEESESNSPHSSTNSVEITGDPEFTETEPAESTLADKSNFVAQTTEENVAIEEPAATTDEATTEEKTEIAGKPTKSTKAKTPTKSAKSTNTESTKTTHQNSELQRHLS